MEGRKAWGKLIIETRSFVRESVVIGDEARRELRSLCGFAHALNARLRNEDDLAAARPWLPRPEALNPHNVCDSILREVGSQCSRLAERQQISDWRYSLLEQRLVGLTEVQATCERIKGTPLPFPYTLLLHRTIYIFCLLLPFALAEPLAGWRRCSPPSGTFFGLDAIGNELEDPFGRDENDLPTDAIVRTVERDVLAGWGPAIAAGVVAGGACVSWPYRRQASPQGSP